MGDECELNADNVAIRTNGGDNGGLQRFEGPSQIRKIGVKEKMPTLRKYLVCSDGSGPALALRLESHSRREVTAGCVNVFIL